jgi:hypothetical protein
MDRLILKDGDDIVVTVMSKDIEMVETDTGFKPALRVLGEGEELQWMISPAAYKILKSLTPPDGWLTKQLRIQKFKDGNITRIVPSLVGSEVVAEVPYLPVGRDKEALPTPAESTVRVLGETVAIKDQPYGVTLSRGMKGQYGYELKVSGHTVQETLDKLYELTKATEAYIAALSVPESENVEE